MSNGLLVLCLLFIKTSLTLCENLCKDDTGIFAFPKITLQPEEKRTIQGGVGDRYNSSAKWTIETSPGGNLSIHIDQESYDLRGGDCIQDGGPSVIIGVFTGEEVVTYTACTTRRVTQPLLSSNVVELYHCNGVDGGTFRVTVTARIAGNLRVLQKEYEEHVEKKDTPQWIGLDGATQGSSIKVTLRNLEVAKSKPGNCKRGYVKFSDKNDQIIDKICNNGGSFDALFADVFNEPFINITFNRAGFDMKIRSVPLKDLPTIDDSTDDTTSTSHATKKTEQPSKEDSSWIYKIIGMALALFLVLLVLMVVGIIFCRRCRNRQQERGKVEFATYTSGYALSHTENKPLSMNNVMYEKVVAGTMQQVEPPKEQNEENGRPPIPEHFMARRSSREKSMDKRYLRESQLMEKYVDLEIAQASHSSAAVKPRMPFKQLKQTEQPVTSAERNKLMQLDPQSGTRATFNSTRPPLPPPLHAAQVDSKQDHAYEKINSPLLDQQDFVTPAYCSLLDEAFIKDNGKTESNLKLHLPVGQYASSENLLDNAHLLQARTSLEDTKAGVNTASDSCLSNHIPQKTVRMGQKNKLPLVGKDGYLSVNSTSTSSQQSPDKTYVSANTASSESLKKHFSKPIPRSGVNSIPVISSLPNLLCTAKTDDVAQPAPHKLRRRDRTEEDEGVVEPQDPSNPSSGRPTHKKSSTNFDSEQSINRYRQPRPSAPDIFVPCAYTSNAEIARIQNHLHAVASRAIESNSSNAGLELTSTGLYERSEVSYFYDSPRPSLDSSREEFLDQTGHYYDTPRPSLPSIFPGS